MEERGEQDRKIGRDEEKSRGDGERGKEEERNTRGEEDAERQNWGRDVRR